MSPPYAPPTPPHFETRENGGGVGIRFLGERAAAELGKGELEQIYVKGQKGYIISMSVGPEKNAVLTVSASENVKLGLIFLDMKRTVDKIEIVLKR